MKRKFLSFLMLGAFVFASTSLMSCKDYDDEIQNLQTQINALTPALEKVKQELQTQITNLKNQLEAKDGELEELIKKAQNTADENAKKIADEILRATAAEAALEARIKLAEEALKEVKELLDTKVDKTEFNEKVADLYAKISAVDGALADHIAKAAEEMAELKNLIQAEETARKAAVADLQEQIDAIKTWKALIDGIDARVAAIEADYLKQADKIALENAITAAKNELETKINEVETALNNKINALDGRVSTLENQMQEAQQKIQKLEAAVDVLNYLLKNELRSLVFKPDFYYAGIEATKLLSLDYFHFVESKSTGKPIPAADADTQEKKGYSETVDYSATNVARTVHERYDSVQAYKTLNFVAKYHMNPSNSDLSKLNANAVSIISMDKEYVPSTRAKGTPVVSVDNSEGKGWFAKDGLLNVNLKVNNPTWLKSIKEDEMVTVFATQVAVRSGDKDTTITSDYAALMYEQIKEIRLAHALVNTVAPAKITQTGLLNTHCGNCDAVTKKGGVSYSMNGSHLFATVAEAKDFVDKTPRTSDGVLGEGQDTVDWNSTIDLSKLVEVHYTTVGGTHEQLTADKLAEYGLEYKFELTKLIIGTNKTSESAQAAIKGNILRPQLPIEKTGKGAGYEETEQSRTTINRVPLVRVSLVDKSTGHVLDYGYLPIRISETATTTPVTSNEVTVEYTSTDKWSHTQYDDCFGAGATKYGLTTTWIETQYDLMKHNALPQAFSREDFEKNYLDQSDNPGPLYQEAPLTVNTDEAQQFIVKRNASGNITGFEKVTSVSKKVGVITYIPDENFNGTRTSVFKWEIDADAAKELFANKKAQEIACKLESKNKAYPDIYVIFKSNPDNITFNQATVKGVVSMDGRKINEYWYALNANNGAGDDGWDEIHAQVKVVEDFFSETAKDLDDTFADVFVGNFKNATVTPNQWITVKTTIDGKEVSNHTNYAASKIKVDFIFESSKNNASFKGIYQNKLTTFKLFASDKDLAAVKTLTAANAAKESGKNLYAYVSTPADAQLIAVIDGADLATMKVALQHSADNAGYAEALLNYKAHNELADDVLKAFVSLVAWYEVNEPAGLKKCYIPLDGNSFIVRFLRPINVFNKNTEVIDATSSVNTPQIINLDDLVYYTDWREAWKTAPDYKTFYGIKAVKLRNVNVGDNVSTNPEVTTNLNQAAGTFVPLTNVSDNVDFIYVADGKLQYRNLSSTVTEFVVKMPVEVEYVWGTIYQDVTVTIKRTQENAKQF